MLEEFIINLCIAIISLGWRFVIAFIIAIIVQFVIYQTTGISLYNKFKKHLIK